MSNLVHRWINELGGQSTEEAGAALGALIADERLRAWRSQLEFTRDQQERLHSDASYEPMSVVEVLDLLRNGPACECCRPARLAVRPFDRLGRVHPR